MVSVAKHFADTTKVAYESIVKRTKGEDPCNSTYRGYRQSILTLPYDFIW